MGSQTIDMFVQGWPTSGGTEWGLGNTNPPTRGVIEDIDVCHGADPDIVFTIVPTPGFPLEFKTSDPVWVKPGNNCPTAPSKSNQIKIASCSTSVLMIHDKNRGNSHRLRYSLQFSNGQALDPIIKNNGGGPPLGRRSLTKVVVGVALVALAGLITWKLF